MRVTAHTISNEKTAAKMPATAAAYQKNMELILHVIRLLSNNDISLYEKLDKSLSMILEGIRADNGSIMLIDGHASKLVVLAATNKNIINKKQALDPGSISGRSFLYKSPIFIDNIHKDPVFAPKARPANYRTDSLMCIPLISHGDSNAFGVINVSDRQDHTCFEQTDLELLKDYAAWISPILQNSVLLEDLTKEKNKYEKISCDLEMKQKELLLATTERSELVQMVIHDFKSPLSAIISNLELLSYMGMTEEQKPVAATAMEGSQKLMEMINDFLELSRIDHRDDAGEPKDISLTDVLHEELEEFRAIAESKNIRVELLPASDIKVRFQKPMIHHLVKNLLSNAIKYTPENGNIKIFWKVQKSKRLSDASSKIVTFCVEDDGNGVPDEMKRAIFDKFSRIKRDKPVQGTGLGLYICNRIAGMMGGRIWVEDVKPRGSRFCVTMCSREKNSVQ